MNVNSVNDVTSSTMDLPVDLMRLRIQSELAEIRDQLEAIRPHDAFAELIDIWHKGFVLALRHPNPAQVIPAFLVDLEKILSETDFQIEVFEEGLSSLVKFVISKAIDPRSLLYSEKIAREVPPTKKESPKVVPDHILEPMRRFNELKARRMQEEADFVAGNKVLDERLNKLGDDFQEKFTKVTQDVKEKLEKTKKKVEECKAAQDEFQEKGDRLDEEFSQRIDAVDRNIQNRLKNLKGRIKQVKIDDAEEREILRCKVKKLKKEVSDLEVEEDLLKTRISKVSKAISEIERANIQLQIDINNVRTELAKKKKNTLKDILKTVGVVIVSVAVKMIVEPYLPGVSVVLGKGGPGLGASIHF